MESIRDYEAIIWPSNANEAKVAEETKFEASSLQQLISLYNKAIEFYSAINDERHIEFLQKLQRILQDDKLQKLLEVIDLSA